MRRQVHPSISKEVAVATIFYVYYLAQEWFQRSLVTLKEMFVTEPVQYTPGRHPAPVPHTGADYSFASELGDVKEELRTTSEIWLDAEAMLLHEELNKLQTTGLTEFNARMDVILSGFEFDETIDHDKNPMALSVRADVLPWREKLADQFRTLADQVQSDCREVYA
jgi:hypothetical protein